MMDRLHRWLAPPDLEDAEQNRRANLLYPILVVLIPATLGFIIILITLAPLNTLGRNVAVAALGIEVLALVVLRSGRVMAAGVGLILALWVAITTSLYAGDGIRSVSALGQVLIILMSGLLVSAPFAAFMTFLTLTANYAVMLLQTTGIRPQHPPLLDLSAYWAVQSLFFLIAVGLTQAYVRSLRRNFSEAETKEEALRERVTELRQAQAQLEMSDQNLRRREAILESVSVAAERLFRGHNFSESVRLVMKDLGVATGVDRVHIFENEIAPGTGDLLSNEVYEWVAEGVPPMLRHPRFKSMHFREAGLMRWVEVLSRNEVIKVSVRDLPDHERMRLQLQGLQSVLIVPIFVGDDWWGFIGFDEAKWEREWSPAEEDAVRGAAGILGGAVQRQKGERALNQSEQRYLAILQDQSEMICRYTPEGRITFANEAFTRFFGLVPSYVTNSLVWAHMEARDAELLRAKLDSITVQRPAAISRNRNTRQDGQKRWIEWTDRGIFDGRGLLIELQAVGRDVDEEVRLRGELERTLRETETQAMTDALTGLFNRRAITDNAEAEWQRALRENRPLSVVVMDVDHLKQINDTYGHLAGDQALRTLGEQVKASMRRYDWAGRWGGDEFMMVLPGADLEAARDVAERLRNRFRKQKLSIDAVEVQLEVSLGVASQILIDPAKDTLEKLFARADEALYRAKQAGRNQVAVG
jgi:diguanylate cyclase (GGDEF)-like protein/PAS domain S-box-containing protein